MMDGSVSVRGFEAKGIEEKHLYNESKDLNLTYMIWSDAEVKEDTIIRRSAFGRNKEDKCICKQVKIV